MRVIAINASPLMDKGNTALLLNPFLDGMRAEGADVELLYTKRLQIRPCQGDFSCWFRSPGQCIYNDDMKALLPRMRDADILVFATPLYLDGMAAPLKNLWDRMLPMLQPYVELRDGHCRHPLREPHKGVGAKVVLVANCGFWELDNFDSLVAHTKAMCRNTKREFAGGLLRPHGPVLSGMATVGAPEAQAVLAAANGAGRELIRSGCIAPGTLEAVCRPLLPLDAYLEVAKPPRRPSKQESPLAREALTERHSR